jgi:diguanylate cyclase (GGDEF)-like protein
LAQPRSRVLRCYIGGVASAGSAAVVVALLIEYERLVRSPAFWIFVVVVVVLESFSIRLPAGQDDSEVTTSTTFGYALLLIEGVGPAAVAFAAGAAANGLTHRKPWFKTAFNAGQFAIAAVVSGMVLSLTAPGYSLIGAAPPFLPVHLPGALLGAAAFIAVNFLLLAVVVALAAGVPVGVYARRNLVAAAGPMTVMLAVSPAVAVVAEASLWYLPLLAVPIVALFKMAEIYIAKEHQQLHDALTDLPNRRLFVDRLAQALLANKRQGRGVAVLALDLDRFKQVNDTLGRAAGDELLRVVSARLSDIVRETDTVARTGADEFGVVLRDVDEGGAARIAQEIAGTLLASVFLDGVTLEVPVSIGIVFALPGDAAEEVIRRADSAMNRAKTLRLGVAWYDPGADPEVSTETRTRLALSNELRTAIDDHQIAVVYQPQISIAEQRVVAVEALARWRHPVRGLIGAGSLIPLAEDMGLIRQLSVQVLRQAIGEVGRWHRMYGIDLRVSVNMVADNLLDPGLVAVLEESIAGSGLRAGHICLELTESDIALQPAESPGVLRDALAQLRAFGVNLSIDDFGTGMSSLARLRELPVDELKIDKSFVDQLGDQRSQAFVRTIVTLGRELGLRIVGEGVEDQPILDTLRSLEVDVAQGYLFSVPLWGEDYPEWHLGWTQGQLVSSRPD